MAGCIMTYVLRAPLDLAASAGYTSLWVPCKGARTVAFRARATNAQGGTIGALEATNALVTGGTGITAANAGLTLSGTWTSTDFSIRGGARCYAAPTAGMYIIVDGVRINHTNGGGTCSGFEVLAEVYYDDASFAPVGSAAV